MQQTFKKQYHILGFVFGMNKLLSTKDENTRTNSCQAADTPQHQNKTIHTSLTGQIIQPTATTNNSCDNETALLQHS